MQFIRRLPLFPSHHFQTHQSLLTRIWPSLIICKLMHGPVSSVHAVNLGARSTTWTQVMNEFHNVLTCPLSIASDWFTAGSREVHACWLVKNPRSARSRRVHGPDLGFTEHELPAVNMKTTTDLIGTYGKRKDFISSYLYPIEIRI